MKIKLPLLIIISGILMLNYGCHIFQGKKHNKAVVTTIDSMAMKQILEAIRASNNKNNNNAADELPYQAAATKYWDLINTDLDVAFDYNKAQLIGLAKITLKPHAYAQDSLVLDAKGMEIKEVSDGDSRAWIQLKYEYNGKQLTIHLRNPVLPGMAKKVVINYIAKPNEIIVKGSDAITSDKGLYFINNDGKDGDKPRQIWTQGETESNSCWFPTLDKPNQKMTQEINITLQDTNDITLSNGTFIARTKNKDGSVTDTWRQNEPASPYLTMMAVGRFYVEHDHWREKEVNYYVEPEFKPYAKLIFGKTPAMIEFFSKCLGVDYAWDKYSQVVVRDYVSGSMENVSATLHGEFLQFDARQYLDDNKEDYICHELFHQWFGDLVTCESWSNLPLNESFATYGEYLWIEHSKGAMEAGMHLDENRKQYMQEATFKQESLIRFHYEDKEDMFDRHTYQKGGCILHMLRVYLGDEVFFKGIKLYLEGHKFQSVEAHNLRLAMEEASGEDLNWFFNQWFYREGHPKVNVGRTYNSDTHLQNINIDFVKDGEHPSAKYKLPLKIDFYFKDSVHRENILIKDWNNAWNFTFTEEPLLINIDAERAMLWEADYLQSKQELMYQVLHAPLYRDKKEAIDKLLDKEEMTIDDRKILIDYCLDQPFWGVKAMGVELMEFMRDKDIYSYYGKLSKLILSEKKSSLRVSLLTVLNKLKKLQDITPVLRACTNDSSYMVMATALELLCDKDFSTSLKICTANESVKNAKVVSAITTIYCKDTLANHALYFQRSVLLAKGFDKNIRFREIGNYLFKTTPELAYQTINALVQIKSQVMQPIPVRDYELWLENFKLKRLILDRDLANLKYAGEEKEKALKAGEYYDKIIELLK